MWDIYPPSDFLSYSWVVAIGQIKTACSPDWKPTGLMEPWRCFPFDFCESFVVYANLHRRIQVYCRSVYRWRSWRGRVTAACTTICVGLHACVWMGASLGGVCLHDSDSIPFCTASHNCIPIGANYCAGRTLQQRRLVGISRSNALSQPPKAHCCHFIRKLRWGLDGSIETVLHNFKLSPPPLETLHSPGQITVCSGITRRKCFSVSSWVVKPYKYLWLV